MNADRKEKDPTLVCTCNDLFINDIQESINFGETEYREIFAVHGLQPRCGECVDHVSDILNGK
ncbi:MULTISPECIES: (2Fe-2S)-binding protein [Neptunomonas]|uniref:Bacterioferritin-associated ferredoxin n=1 Tax=Neptunomonas qingdaonensis TaxID=1045558 RepID=A0A1I2QVM9_9GAMM|nr:(2Fe-2S)-binding protein [Neptunomonas qingdaonensis]SFG29681.1 bacterioferritin-associated ferredoxin [Neptunomonas qingdaonensis]